MTSGRVTAEHLGAALERRAAEVVGAEVEALDERAERTVEDDDRSWTASR